MGSKTRINIRVLLAVIMLLNIFWIYGTKAATDYVIDDYDGLSDNEETILESTIDSLMTQHDLDIVIVITDDVDGKTSEAYADDYYDYNGYGEAPYYDGILMLVNMADREVHFSTTGSDIINLYAPYVDNELYDAVRPYLSDGDFYGACTSFLNMVDEIQTNNGLVNSSSYGSSYSSSSSSSNYNYKPSFGQRILDMVFSPLPWIVALIISLGATTLITLSSKGKVTTNNRTYESEGSFHLEHVVDNYINETTTRQRINNNSNGSGGSSHSGSSGRSHGGGGGGF